MDIFDRNLYDKLLNMTRLELVDECVESDKAVEICSSDQFYIDYIKIHPAKSLYGGRNEKDIFPMLPLSHYGKLGQKLGSGTFAKVFQVIGENGEAQYAVKTSKNNHENGVTTDVLIEISVLRKLNHPNILKIIDIVDFDVKDDKNPSILLNLASGTLQDYIHGKKRTLEINKSYMYQLARGLKYLHENNIVHTDIKPPNILLMDSLDRVVFADFGIAKAGFIPSKHGLNIQTLWWRAPEILLGDRSYDKSVDVFSLGVIFVELFLGQYLFNLNNETDVLRKQISVLGNMTEKEWPGIKNLPVYDETFQAFAEKRQIGKFDEKVKDIRVKNDTLWLPDEYYNLIKFMTFPNPNNRIDIEDVISSIQNIDPMLCDYIDKKYPYIDNSPYICGMNLDSSLQVSTYKNKSVTNSLFILFEWLLEVKQGYLLSTESFCHARLLFDFYTSKYFQLSDDEKKDLFPFIMKNMQCIGSVCLLISSKLFEDNQMIDIGVLRSISNGIYESKQIEYAERSILKVVNFDLMFPTMPEYIYFALRGFGYDFVEIKKSSLLFSELSCCMSDPINAKLVAYASIFISLACSDYTGSLPKCFFDESKDVKDIINQSDLIMVFIQNKKDYLNRVLTYKDNRKKIVDYALNNWTTSKARYHKGSFR